MSGSGFDRVTAHSITFKRTVFQKGNCGWARIFLKKAGLEDNLKGRLKLVNRLKQDMICLSMAPDALFESGDGVSVFPCIHA